MDDQCYYGSHRTKVQETLGIFHLALLFSLSSTPVFLPGESRDGRAWWAAVYGVAQSWTRLKRLSSSSSSSMIGGSETQKSFSCNLVQFSSTLALAHVHRVTLTTWVIISFRSPALPWTCLSVCGLWVCELQCHGNVSLWLSLKFLEARRRRKKEGCSDLPAFPKTGYFLFLRIMRDCEGVW